MVTRAMRRSLGERSLPRRGFCIRLDRRLEQSPTARGPLYIHKAPRAAVTFEINLLRSLRTPLLLAHVGDVLELSSTSLAHTIFPLKRCVVDIIGCDRRDFVGKFVEPK